MDALDLIKTYEGCSLKAYPDPASGGKPYTIGYGSTVNKDGQPFKLGDVITADQAEALLIRDINDVKNNIAKDADLDKLPAGCIDAIVSLTYNIGFSAFKKSKCYQAIISKDLKAFYANWDWINAAGRPMLGLARRRAKELSLFLDNWKI